MRLLSCFALATVTLAAFGCGESGSTTSSSSTTTTSASTTSGGSGGAGGSTGTAVGTGGSGGTGGTGGAGGSEEPWPTCESEPADVDAQTIPAIWTANPSAPQEVWVSGAVVTAVSFGGCSQGFPCEIFLQDAPTYASFAAAAQHGIKLFASGATAGYFDTIAVGDVVDVQAHAWRYDVDGQNELLLQVNLQLPGCARAVDSATPTPIPGVTLAELTEDAYLNTHGPLLVEVDAISGMPQAAGETFGLWNTGELNMGDIVSMSPYFLPNGSFTGLTFNQIVDFSSVVGVFGVFVPDETSPTFLHLYPRTMSDVVVAN